MVFWKLRVFFDTRKPWKSWVDEKSKTIDANNQNDSGTLLERYPEGHTCDRGAGKKSEACRARRRLLLFRPRAWNPNCPQVRFEAKQSHTCRIFRRRKDSISCFEKKWQGSCEPSSFLWNGGMSKKNEISPKPTAKSQQQCQALQKKGLPAIFLQEGNLYSFGVESTQCKLPKLFFTCCPATGA